MTTLKDSSADVRWQGVAVTAQVEPRAEKVRLDPLLRGNTLQPIELRPSGSLFSPKEFLVCITGLLGVSACIAPWLARGWLWFGLIAILISLLAGYDAIVLWLARQECVPVLLQSEKGLRGREGQTIEVSFALRGLWQRPVGADVRVAIMPATQESETAIRVESYPQPLMFGQPDLATEGSTRPSASPLQLWPWTAEIALLRRGLWPGPTVGVERPSRLRMWRLRRWYEVPTPLRIDANLRSGRQEILRSPVYRLLVASQQTPWTGQGRDFERLRDYQPGDNYSEIAWKTTARRGVPVTRLFQWEQKQEVYFVVDQSRASAHALHLTTNSDSAPAQERSSRRMLDLEVETALVGATVARELGDEFGLITYADGAKSWLRAGSGQYQFYQFRDRLLNIEPLPTTADYEALFADIRVRLRRRAYLVMLADLTERSISDSLRRGAGLVRSSHALLMTSILPAHARPAFSRSEDLNTDQDVYGALAADRENQRLAALARQLRQLDLQLRYVPAEKFLRTAVEGYLENKREQRL
jgi:uncharacterized protein (DUF58 family)